MSFPYHTTDLIAGSQVNYTDRVKLGSFPNVATAVGGSAGAAVTKAVTFGEPIAVPYSVQVTANQDAVCFVTNKTANGFTVNLTPRLAASTLTAGTVDIIVFG